MIVSVDSSQIHALENENEMLKAWIAAAAVQAGGLHLDSVDLAVGAQAVVRQRPDGTGGQHFIVMSPSDEAPDNIRVADASDV